MMEEETDHFQPIEKKKETEFQEVKQMKKKLYKIFNQRKSTLSKRYFHPIESRGENKPLAFSQDLQLYSKNHTQKINKME